MSELVISDDDWKVVEERLKSMPAELNLGLLENSFSKQQMMEEVTKRSDVGVAYAQMQIDFIKWMTKQSKAF